MARRWRPTRPPPEDSNGDHAGSRDVRPRSVVVRAGGGHRRVRLLLARFESGDIGPDEWRAFRLLRGTYGQRQTGDAQMMRIKIPQGILVRAQLDALADVAERYSRGFGHITTRQNVQLHFVKLHDAEPAMRELAAAGMTTREACGNSVRNITACPYSGVAEGRGVRRHAVRRSADALPAAPSVELGAAAQVQDRLRRLLRGSHRLGDQRYRLERARRECRRTRRSRLQGDRRRRHGDDDEGRATCCTSSCPPTRCSTARKRSSASSIASATTSTSRRTG